MVTPQLLPAGCLETGLQAARWQKLGRYHLSNSISDEEALLYLATDLVRGPASPDDSEELSLRWVGLPECLRMIDRGEITDAMSVIALQRIAAQRPEH